MDLTLIIAVLGIFLILGVLYVRAEADNRRQALKRWNREGRERAGEFALREAKKIIAQRQLGQDVLDRAYAIINPPEETEE